jgi:hypothetical protein
VIKLNVPDLPTPVALPTDPRAAWVNGYRTAALNYERARRKIYPYLTGQAKQALRTDSGLNPEVLRVPLKYKKDLA